MGDAVNPGDAGKIDVAAITKAVTEAVMSGFKVKFDEFSKNQQIISDTLVEQGKQLAASAKVTEELDKRVEEKLKAREDAARQTAEQAAARKAFIESDKSGLKKLPAAYFDKLGTDPAKFEAEAAAILADWQKFAKDNGVVIPDVGGATREGGETASGTKPAATGGRYDFIKMPAGVDTGPTPAAASAK